MTDDIDDIFDIMDRVFGRSSSRPRKPQVHISPEKFERQIDDNNIYYTFELTKSKKEDINVEWLEDKYGNSIDGNGFIKVLVNNFRSEPFVLKLPYPIEEDNINVTFRNGILDITCPIDKDKSKRVDITE